MSPRLTQKFSISQALTPFQGVYLCQVTKLVWHHSLLTKAFYKQPLKVDSAQTSFPYLPPKYFQLSLAVGLPVFGNFYSTTMFYVYCRLHASPDIAESSSDVFLMDVLQTIISGKELRIINYCRIFLQVELLSDVILLDG